MARTRLVNGKSIPFTAEQEIVRDAEELAEAGRVKVKRLNEADILRQALISKGVLVKADIDKAEADLRK